jgi:ketosteroid isomerase-like protein
MSQKSVESVGDGYERFAASGEFVGDVVTDDFVWDMSNFHGWPEQQVYPGRDGARKFLSEWTDAWEEWEFVVDALHDKDDKVVALMRQRGRSKTSGMPVEMSFAQVWTVREDGMQTRMDMYSDPAEALEAAGLSG